MRISDCSSNVCSSDLKREGFVVFERGPAVEAETRDTGNCEFDCQHVACLAGWVVAGRAVDGTHRAVGKGVGVEAGSSLGVLIVPEANRVLCHYVSFRFEVKPRPYIPICCLRVSAGGGRWRREDRKSTRLNSSH